MEPIIDWEYFLHLRHNVNLYSNFYVSLNENRVGIVNGSEKKRICDNVLTPLCGISDSVYLYGKFTDKELENFPGLKCLKKRSKIQIFDKKLSKYIEFMDNPVVNDLRGSLLFHLKINENILSNVFSRCFDPIAMSGFGSVCTKAAIRYAKSKMTDTDFFAILSEANSGFEWLFFLANEPVFKKLTELAGKHCKARQWFVNCYGPGVTLAPLEEKARYDTGFPE